MGIYISTAHVTTPSYRDCLALHAITQQEGRVDALLSTLTDPTPFNLLQPVHPPISDSHPHQSCVKLLKPRDRQASQPVKQTGRQTSRQASQKAKGTPCYICVPSARSKQTWTPQTNKPDRGCQDRKQTPSEPTLPRGSLPSYPSLLKNRPRIPGIWAPGANEA
jgi:hypothetical protein